MTSQNSYHKSFKLDGKYFNSPDEIISYLATVSSEMGSFMEQWFNESDFVEVETSGSTGKAKKIAIKKASMVQSALATGSFFNIKEGTTALLCMPIAYIAGKMMLIRALTLGWNLDITSPTSSPLVNVEKHYDFTALVPMQLQNSIPFLDTIGMLIVGGGVVSRDLHLAIQKSKPIIYETYGMTETVTHIAVKKLNHLGTDSLFDGDCFSALPGIIVGSDKRGCLTITAPLISENKIITNDLVELKSSTKFKWLGRNDNIVNSGGVKLIPERIEKKLAAYIEAPFFLCGMSDKILGEKLVLIVEGPRNESIIKIVQNCKVLNKYEYPKNIFFMEKFIYTESNKIKRRETGSLLKKF